MTESEGETEIVTDSNISDSERDSYNKVPVTETVKVRCNVRSNDSDSDRETDSKSDLQ